MDIIKQRTSIRIDLAMSKIVRFSKWFNWVPMQRRRARAINLKLHWKKPKPTTRLCMFHSLHGQSWQVKSLINAWVVSVASPRLHQSHREMDQSKTRLPRRPWSARRRLPPPPPRLVLSVNHDVVPTTMTHKQALITKRRLTLPLPVSESEGKAR